MRLAVEEPRHLVEVVERMARRRRPPGAVGEQRCHGGRDFGAAMSGRLVEVELGGRGMARHEEHRAGAELKDGVRRDGVGRHRRGRVGKDVELVGVQHLPPVGDQ